MSKTVFKEKIQSFLNDTRNKGNTYAHNGFSSQIMPRSCDHVFCVTFDYSSKVKSYETILISITSRFRVNIFDITAYLRYPINNSTDNPREIQQAITV